MLQPLSIMFTTWKITARLSTSRQVEISYNLLGNVLHAQVNGKHMDLSRNNPQGFHPQEEPKKNKKGDVNSNL